MTRSQNVNSRNFFKATTKGSTKKKLTLFFIVSISNGKMEGDWEKVVKLNNNDMGNNNNNNNVGNKNTEKRKRNQTVECKYGKSCYSKDPKHLATYSHPPKDQPPNKKFKQTSIFDYDEQKSPNSNSQWIPRKKANLNTNISSPIRQNEKNEEKQSPKNINKNEFEEIEGYWSVNDVKISNIENNQQINRKKQKNEINIKEEGNESENNYHDSSNEENNGNDEKMIRLDSTSTVEISDDESNNIYSISSSNSAADIYASFSISENLPDDYFDFWDNVFFFFLFSLLFLFYYFAFINYLNNYIYYYFIININIIYYCYYYFNKSFTI